jgi:hypothetical protein
VLVNRNEILAKYVSLSAENMRLRSALEQVRRTDYVSNHLNCACYICKALGAKERITPGAAQ